jgi:hypothetical protein
VKLLTIPPQHLKNQLIASQRSASDTRIPNQGHYGFCSCIWPIKKFLSDKSPHTMKRGRSLPNPLWMENAYWPGGGGGRKVTEGHYYDKRGNNYVQPLVVCIGCKSFIRWIIRTAACTTIYLLFTNCYSNPLHVYRSRHRALLYICMHIRQHQPTQRSH